MVEMGRKKGTVRFTFRPASDVPLKRAEVAGDFSDWQPIRMRKQKDGFFVSVVPLSAGTYEYKFILDGQWAVDPDNNAWALNSYGTLNSIVRVD